MDKLKLKKKRLLRRKNHIKKKLIRNGNRLRLCLSRSNKNLYAQIIDDTIGKTLLGISTLSEDFSGMKSRGGVEAAKKLGGLVAERAVEKGIKRVVFDRNGNLYHGKIKSFADAAREKGLEF